jgi:hypothetical protein
VLVRLDVEPLEVAALIAASTASRPHGRIAPGDSIASAGARQ